MEEWRNGKEEAEGVIAYAKYIADLIYHEMELLGAHEDFSLHHSLERLCRSGWTNPNFKSVLKANAKNDYCRSFVYELFKACYIPEFEKYRQWLGTRFMEGDRSRWKYPETIFLKKKQAISEYFYGTPLKELAPDVKQNEKCLPVILNELASITNRLIKECPKHFFP